MSPLIISRLFILSALLLVTNSLVTSQPKMVVEVFRHGARGPIYGANDVWGNYVGQLTPVGMRMHYLLGVALKDKYPHLLGKYDPAKIIIRSTNYNRTIMSAYSQLYGIYGGTGPGFTGAHADVLSIPPYADYDSNNTMRNLTNDAALPGKFQVLPLHVDSLTTDKLLRGSEGCPPSWDPWSFENLGDEETASVFKNDLAEISKKMKAAGLKVESLDDLAAYGDTAIANKFQNTPLPGGISIDSQEYKDLKFATEWWFFKAFISGKNEAALHSLNLFNGIRDYINGRLNGTNVVDFAFLSGHDDTLAPVLVAFNITTKECLLANYRAQKTGEDIPYPSCVYPGFASNLVFEVYGDNADEAQIKFYYNGVGQAICGKTGENNNTCGFKEFSKWITELTKGYTVSDYNKKCEIKVGGAKPIILVNTYKKLNDAIGAICVVLVVSLLGTCFANLRKQGIIRSQGLLKNASGSGFTQL